MMNIDDDLSTVNLKNEDNTFDSGVNHNTTRRKQRGIYSNEEHTHHSSGSGGTFINNIRKTPY
jgi:hypothetical protein